MEEEVNISAIHKAELMDEEYPEKNDLFEQFLLEHVDDNEMEIEEIVKPSHSRSSKTLNKISDFRKILNSSSSNERLIPSSIKHNSSRQNSLGGQLQGGQQHSMDSQSFRKSFKKKFQQSFSMSHTIRDSSSQFSQRSDSKSSRNIIIIPHVYDEQKRMEEQKKVGCNCKKSKCLKLYCECFQKQMFCSKTCNCHGCGNHPGNKQQHKKAIFDALARNAHTMSHGFQQEKQKPKVQNVPEPKVFSLGVHHEEVRKGCKCKKTKCLKKYCECYQSGVPCTVFCRCEGCFNNKQTPQTNYASSPDNVAESHQFMQLMNNI